MQMPLSTSINPSSLYLSPTLMLLFSFHQPDASCSSRTTWIQALMT